MEGNYESPTTYLGDLDLYKDEIILSKAVELYEKIKSADYPWIVEALVALEKSNIKDGNTALHMIIDVGNK